MSDACHMTSMPHALASGLARSSLTLWGLSYILLCGGNSIDLRYTPPAFFGDTVTTRSDLFRSGDHLISATHLHREARSVTLQGKEPEQIPVMTLRGRQPE